MGHVRLGNTQTHGSDKPLKFWRLPGEVLPHECHLGDHSLPCLLLPLSTLHNLEHFFLSNGPHRRQRHRPLPCLLFPLLLYSVAKDFSTRDTLPVQQIGRNSTRRNYILVLVLIFALLVHSNRFAHNSLLLVAFLVVQLGLETEGFLFIFSQLMGSSRFLLALAFKVIQPKTMALPVKLYVISLRHFDRSENKVVAGSNGTVQEDAASRVKASTLQPMNG
mmetsp:Transcript_8486/g.28445  ORF Transcript_8486/g.28445 Transcript_8486/m.28445 type:complete len:220 (-) Transcript_8486:132-791(-)